MSTGVCVTCGGGNYGDPEVPGLHDKLCPVVLVANGLRREAARTAELELLRSIVSDLSESDPRTPVAYCVHCEALILDSEDQASDHLPSCVWRRAKEFVDGQG